MDSSIRSNFARKVSIVTGVFAVSTVDAPRLDALPCTRGMGKAVLAGSGNVVSALGGTAGNAVMEESEDRLDSTSVANPEAAWSTFTSSESTFLAVGGRAGKAVMDEADDRLESVSESESASSCSICDAFAWLVSGIRGNSGRALSTESGKCLGSASVANTGCSGRGFSTFCGNAGKAVIDEPEDRRETVSGVEVARGCWDFGFSGAGDSVLSGRECTDAEQED